MDYTTALDVFADGLETIGFGEAPNGVSYRIVPSSAPGRVDCYAVEQTKDGLRRLVVGYNSEPFRTIEAARLWAYMDGRYEFKPGTPYPQRKAVS